MKKTQTELYNGAQFCQGCSNCPVVTYLKDEGVVNITDPAKPEKGSFTMTVEEYNALIANAKKVS